MSESNMYHDSEKMHLDFTVKETYIFVQKEQS